MCSDGAYRYLPALCCRHITRSTKLQRVCLSEAAAAAATGSATPEAVHPAAAPIWGLLQLYRFAYLAIYATLLLYFPQGQPGCVCSSGRQQPVLLLLFC